MRDGPQRQCDQNPKRDVIRNSHGMAVPIDSHAWSPPSMILGNPYRRARSARLLFLPQVFCKAASPDFQLSQDLASRPARSGRPSAEFWSTQTGEITGRARRAALSSWNVVACRIKATAFVPVVQVILDDVSGIVGSFTWINGQVLTQCLYFKLPARRELELAAAANESATQGEHAFTNSANRCGSKGASFSLTQIQARSRLRNM